MLMLIDKAKAKVLSSKAFLYFAKLWIEGMAWYGMGSRCNPPSFTGVNNILIPAFMSVQFKF